MTPITTESVVRLLPREPGLWAHCRRVAALAQTLAHQLSLPAEQKGLLKAACLLHHRPFDLMSGPGLGRVLADLMPDPPPVIGEPVPSGVREILIACDHPGTGEPPERQLGEVLRLCDAYDQEYEAAAIELRTVEDILCDLSRGVDAGMWSRTVFGALDQISQVRDFGKPETWPVSAFPAAVAQVLALLGDPMASLERISKTAGRDPSVAGRLVQLANSPMFPSRHEVSTISAAILRIGIRQSQKVTLSLAMHSVLRDRAVAGLWPHSLEVADLTEQVAALSSAIDPDEAYLCGLLHDVGRLVTATLPVRDSARIKGLQGGGCPSVYAESLLLRTHHGSLSARLAEHWRLPANLIEGIACHHHPETTRSRLAHALYLAEYLAGGEEDIPSQTRLQVTLSSLGIARESLDQICASPVAGWMAAA